MSNNSPNNKQLNQYVFTVDLLVEAETNGIALEAVLHMLNAGTIKDYKVTNGIQLGAILEAAVQQHAKTVNHNNADFPPSPLTAATPPSAAKPSAAGSTSKKAAKTDKTVQTGFQEQIVHILNEYQLNRTLVRLAIVKEKGVRMSIPCRILNLDPETGNVTVYHVDEKKVYLFTLNEIEDINATA